jgi:SNF2-related domain
MRPLYAYQRRTVARMLQQELDPGVAPDPLYIPIHGVQLEGCNRVFYLQPSTMEILSECPLRAQAKGGILCEEMGTGKTCIVLALIMATKHQLSSPEEPLWDEPDRPILTPLALRHFLTRQFENARQVVRINDRPSNIPSLVEMLTHFIRASPDLIKPSGFDNSLKDCLPDHLWESIAENHPFYHVFERLPASLSSRRRYLDRGPRKVYLTSATLIIVPRAILEQWNSEINKHCEAGSIRHISLDIGPKARPMPSAPILASMYDVGLVAILCLTRLTQFRSYL